MSPCSTLLVLWGSVFREDVNQQAPTEARWLWSLDLVMQNQVTTVMKNPCSWGQTAWIQIPGLPLAGCVTSAKLLDTVSRFPRLLKLGNK